MIIIKKLTIGMIIKDESECLDRCLRSLVPVLEKVDSELVIVDTGSSDNSVEIAKKYTDKVYFYEWTNDFSAARNESLKYANGEWFMVVDADEFLEDSSELISFFNSCEYKNYDAASYIQRNFSEPDSEKIYNDAFVLRLFERKSGREFYGYVHESVKTDDIHMVKMLSKSIFKHWGYCYETDMEKYSKKISRYKELIELEIKNNPDNSIRYSQLSSVYCAYAKFQPHKKEYYRKLAVESLEKGIEKSLKNGRYLEVCAFYKNIANILYKSQKYAEVKKICDLYFGIKAKENINTLGSDLDMYFFSGIYYYKKADFEKAADDCEKYIALYKAMVKGCYITAELMSVHNSTQLKYHFYSVVGIIIEAYARMNNTKKVDEFISEFLSEEDKNSPNYLCMRINNEFSAMDILGDEKRLLGIVKRYSNKEKSVKDYLNSGLEERVKTGENKEQTLKILSECEDLEPMRLNLYKMRYAEIAGSELDWSCLEYYFSQNEHLDSCYGDVLYFAVKYGVNFDNIARIFDSDNTEAYLNSMTIDKNELRNVLNTRIDEDMQECDVSACIIFIKLLRYFMLKEDTDKNIGLNFFARYAQLGFEYISLILNMDNLNENSAYVLPKNIRELYLSSFAFVELSDGNYAAASEYLNKISEFCPEFKVLYNIVYALNVKNMICTLVKSGNLAPAKELINQYTELYGSDEDIDEIKNMV